VNRKKGKKKDRTIKAEEKENRGFFNGVKVIELKTENFLHTVKSHSLEKVEYQPHAYVLVYGKELC
jgi:hypothetical protein